MRHETAEKRNRSSAKLLIIHLLNSGTNGAEITIPKAPMKEAIQEHGSV